MRYWAEISWLISWPVLIYLTYRLTVWAVRQWEKRQPEEKGEL
ncbi:MAG: hypothetical protein AB7S54_13495 [Bacteroidales bacterium]